MAQIETLIELRNFLRLFGSGRDEPEFQKLIGDLGTSELSVTVGEIVQLLDINTGAIANSTEYERRLVRFLVEMLDMNKAQGFYLDNILDDWTNNKRKTGYSDADYLSLTKTKLLALKESNLAIASLLQPFSSQPVLILDNGSWWTTMFANMSYANYFQFTRDGTTGFLVSPAVLGGGSSSACGIYCFIAKVQPIDEVSEDIINELLKLAHVAGVKYFISYYTNPPWHPPI